MPTLIISITSKEQLEAVHKAEQYLLKAGVEFDTGSLVAEGRVQERHWELDWSLKGATLKIEKEERSEQNGSPGSPATPD